MAAPKFYAWAPRFTFDSAPIAAFSWETAPSSFGAADYKHIGMVHLTYLSSASATLTFTVDGVAQSGLTIASSSGVQYQLIFRAPVMKGKLFKMAFSSAGEFRLDTRDSFLEVKDWGSAAAYSRIRVFGDGSLVEN